MTLRFLTKRQNSPYDRACDFRRNGDDLSALCFAREQLRWTPNHKAAKAMASELAPLDKRFAQAEQFGAEFAWIAAQIAPHTMLSLERVYSLYTNARRICEDDQPGCFVECGVAGGGSTLLLALVIALHSRSPRQLFSFDTFSGMPDPGPEDTAGGKEANATGWGVSTCSAPIAFIESLLTRYGVKDKVELHQGLFQDTLPGFAGAKKSISLLHMDGDWYSSTMAILDSLYSLTAKGSFVQIDDYGHWDGCKKAVHDFFEKRGMPIPELQVIDFTGRSFTVPG